MLRSIATLCVAGTLPEKLRAIAQAGFDGVEIFEPDFTEWGQSPARLATLCRELGLTIFLYQPLRNVDGVPPEAWPQTRERAYRTFETMREMGCRSLLACSNLEANSSADPARQTEDLARLAEIAAEFDARVGYEALAWGRHVNRYTQAWERVKSVDHPALGLVLDSFHVLARGDTLALEGIAPEKIFFTQFADAPHKDLPLEAWSRHFRAYPGEGSLPVVDFAGTLMESGYQSPWSLEVFSDAWQRAPAEASARAGLASLDWLAAQLNAPRGEGDT
ncbi:sugar phosphate isomerase/epimerase [Cronobacter malonaticus]|uniref:sugar phosphate isomerase/epimerase family protein n=1 Tax=Cronobacter malonaticus TaxID=413503 RepID=UPI000519C238|nr:sugar phosphate isomerase/epimerase [Cronobacter malonaticus]EGT4382223.1 sugar phosphate isomerase/epimerase [Cronobacter malonaticus]EGT4421118.1 sugar phosphate isomerase/epimerase [Cronobacter malonaticus]EGT4445947.1 sugar phosphate isomerase/epimerase [Cronobacter malonaticus]EGT4453105.1 sugar phosphate isomerase/epimerase [Cronobacter malonaticus]EKP4391263.1 sugar phosphate isomerase/epimerase [Cronobacter malonaticus]